MRSTGPILAAGAISLANHSLLNSEPINWKIPVATGIAAIMVGGIEKIWPEGGLAMGAMLLVAVLFVPVGNKPSPIENLVSFLQKNGFTT
jgi:hypothetical protein